VRNGRLELETFRTRLEGMPFDVVSGGECPRSVDYINDLDPLDLAEMFNSIISGRYERLKNAIANAGGMTCITSNPRPPKQLFKSACWPAPCLLAASLHAPIITAIRDCLSRNVLDQNIEGD
jgi:hypothetical protein